MFYCSGPTMDGGVDDRPGAHDVREFLAVGQARQGGFFPLLKFDGPSCQGEHLPRGDHHDAVFIGDHGVPGIYHDTATLDRRTEFAFFALDPGGNGARAPGPDGDTVGAQFTQVSDETVDDDPGNSSLFGGVGHGPTHGGGDPFAAAIHDKEVPGPGAAHGVMQDTAVGTWHSHGDRRAHRPDILQVRFYIAAYNALGYEVANGCRFCREKNFKFFRGDLLW
ncbi:hypothetical protein EMIT0P12_10133 [Pseudomonas sp. IT-P12]